MKVTKNISLSVGALSVPIFIELFLQMLLGNVDQFMLSHYAETAVAAVANANQIINMILFLLIVMSTATTILIAQYLGARRPDKIDEVYTISIAFHTLFSIIAGGGVIVFHETLCQLLGVPPEILEETSLYMNIVAASIPITGIYTTYVAVFRGHSLPRIAMWIALVMNVVHIILNYALIYGWGPIPSMGVLGVSLSTVISKALGLGLIIWCHQSLLSSRLKVEYLRPFRWDTLRQLLFISVPSGGETLSYQLSQTVIMKMVNLMGLVVITTKVYVYIIATFCYMYTIALANAAQIVVGFLIGAKREDEVSRRVWLTTAVGISIGVGLSTIFYFACEPVMRLVTDNQEIIDLAKAVLFIEIFLEIGRGANIVLVQCLQAAGDIRIPVFVGIFGMWVFAVSLSYYFGIVLGWGLVGVWIAMAIDEIIRAMIFVWRWQSNKWRGRSLISV